MFKAKAGSLSLLLSLTVVARKKKVNLIIGLKASLCIIVSTITCLHECLSHRECFLCLYTVLSAVFIGRSSPSPVSSVVFECVCLISEFICF